MQKRKVSLPHVRSFVHTASRQLSACRQEDACGLRCDYKIDELILLQTCAVKVRIHCRKDNKLTGRANRRTKCLTTLQAREIYVKTK